MNIVEWAVALIDRFGGPGVAFLIALESVFPPIPSEVILPLAGVSAAGEGHALAGMYLWALLGSVTGALILYGLGRALGRERLRRAIILLPLLSVEDFDRSVAWMDRHGTKGIFWGRMVPGVRSLVSIPAGIYRMGLGRFVLLTAAGSALWNALFVGLGYRLGENWHVIEPYTDAASTVVYAIVAALVLWSLWRLIRRERRRRELGLPDPDEAAMAELDDESERADAR